MSKLDKDFFTKKRKNLAYEEQLLNKKIVFNNQDLDQLNIPEIAQIAINDTDLNSFLENYSDDVDYEYSDLNKNHISLAVCFGIIGAFSSYLVNKNSKTFEDIFLKFHNLFKTNEASPIDYKTGSKHRYMFGHDFNLWQTLPDGYTFYGKDVGGKTLYSLIFDYCNNLPGSHSFLTTHLNSILHIITHYLSDLPTKDGIPLPFSSFFTTWKEADNASGYTAENPLLKALGREYGSINLADISSYAVIKLLLKAHNKILFRKFDDNDDVQLHLSQMSVISYGVCMIIQMMLIITNIRGVTGKLNYIIVIPFLRNAIKVMLITNKKHKKIIKNYQKSISLLNNNEIDLELWIKQTCH